MADGQHMLEVLREDEGLLADAEAQLLDVIRGVQETGKGGKLTITLNVKQPQHASDRAAIWISGNVKATVPAPDTEDHMFFAVGDEITRRDPRQPALPQFETVHRGPVDPGDVDHETGEINEGAAQ